MDINQLELGALIRKKRKSLGLTLSDLADENISVPTISNIERGISGSIASDKVAYVREKIGLTDEELNQMRHSSAEGLLELNDRLGMIEHLIQIKLLNQARSELNKLTKDARLQDNPQEEIQSQLLKGWLLHREGKWDRAKQVLQQVLRLIQEQELSPQTNFVAETYHLLSLGAFYGDQEYGKAIEFADQALAAFDEGGSKPELKGRILYDIANYYFHLEQLAVAYKYVVKSQQASEQTNDIRSLILGYNLEALIYKQQEQYESAVYLFRKSLNLSTRLHREARLSTLLYLNLGETQSHLQAFDKALESLNIAYELCRQTDDRYTKTLVAISYAEVYYRMEAFDEAQRYLNEATKSAKKYVLPQEYLQLLALQAKVALHRAENDIEEICREGIRVADHLKLSGKKKDFHVLLAKYYKENGVAEKFHKELEHIYDVEILLQGGAVT